MTRSKFFTDSEGRVRYVGNDRKAQDKGSAQVVKTETAPQRGKKGQFITKDGKVIFIGGPGSGSGSSGGGAVSSKPTNVRQQHFDSIISIARNPSAYLDRDWAQYPTVKDRALGLLARQLETYQDRGDEQAIADVLWMIGQVKKGVF